MEWILTAKWKKKKLLLKTNLTFCNSSVYFELRFENAHICWTCFFFFLCTSKKSLSSDENVKTISCNWVIFQPYSTNSNTFRFLCTKTTYHFGIEWLRAGNGWNTFDVEKSTVFTCQCINSIRLIYMYISVEFEVFSS